MTSLSMNPTGLRVFRGFGGDQTHLLAFLPVQADRVSEPHYRLFLSTDNGATFYEAACEAHPLMPIVPSAAREVTCPGLDMQYKLCMDPQATSFTDGNGHTLVHEATHVFTDYIPLPPVVANWWIAAWNPDSRTIYIAVLDIISSDWLLYSLSGTPTEGARSSYPPVRGEKMTGIATHRGTVAINGRIGGYELILCAPGDCMYGFTRLHRIWTGGQRLTIHDDMSAQLEPRN